MNDEIKEILDRLERIDHKAYIAFEFADGATFDEMARCFEERKKLADYITNLQEENKNKTDYVYDLLSEKVNLQEENERLKVNCNLGYEELKNARDYKSRVEKAVEYNNQIIKDTKDFYRPTTDIIYSGDCLIDIAKNNINILQGGEDDNN